MQAQDDLIQDLLSENEALRSAIRRSEEDWEKEAALVDQMHTRNKQLETALAREQARILFLTC